MRYYLSSLSVVKGVSILFVLGTVLALFSTQANASSGLVWQKSMDSPFPQLRGGSVQQADGGYIIAGTITYGLQHPQNADPGVSQACLLKVSGDGSQGSQDVSLSVEPNQSSAKDGSKSFDIVLNGAENGLAGYDLTISTNSPAADITSVSWPSWAQQLHNNTTLTPGVMRINGVDLSNNVRGATNVTLATVTIREDTPNTTISINNASLDDDNGNQILPAIMNGSTSQLKLDQPKLSSAAAESPASPDYGFEFDDTNGNGLIDFGDMAATCNELLETVQT